MSKTIEESIDTFAEDVEKELSDRKREAIREAKEVDMEEAENTNLRFSTPSVIGGRKEDSSYYSDKIILELDENMPNGTGYFKVRMPSENEITDETHELNRLLSLYNVEPDEILDLVGEELPVVPKGDYSNPKSMAYEIDIPPIPTTPNMLIYKARRLALKARLIRWGRTPKVRTNMFGDVEAVGYESKRGVPSMHKSAYDVFNLLGWESSAERFVPTNRGMKTLFATQVLVSLLPLLFFGLNLLTLMWVIISMMTTIVVNSHALDCWIKSTSRKIKNKYFPEA